MHDQCMWQYSAYMVDKKLGGVTVCVTVMVPHVAWRRGFKATPLH